MTKETMNVHKALSELKILDDRIFKSYGNQAFVFANKHANTKVNGVPIEEYKKEIESAFQRTTDLIARRDAIKRAVVQSNAATKVTVAGKEYTVAEAIEAKNHGIPTRREFLRHLVANNDLARKSAERANGSELEQRADAYIVSMYGKQTDAKGLSDEMRKTREDFIKAQTMEIVDPLRITEIIKKMTDELDAFTVEVDAALSTSNAVTEITVEY